MVRRLPDTITLRLDRVVEDHLIKLTEAGGAHECWIHRRGDTFAKLTMVMDVNGKVQGVSTARVAYVLATGQRLTEGADVGHACANNGVGAPLCVNPDHLFTEKVEDFRRRLRRKTHLKRLRRTFSKEKAS